MCGDNHVKKEMHLSVADLLVNPLQYDPMVTSFLFRRNIIWQFSNFAQE